MATCYTQQFDTTGDTLTFDIENYTADMDFVVWASVHRQPGGACYTPGTTTDFSKGVVVTAGNTHQYGILNRLKKLSDFSSAGEGVGFTTAETSLEAWPITETSENYLALLSVTYVALKAGHGFVNGTSFADPTAEPTLIANAQWSTMGNVTMMPNFLGGSLSGAGTSVNHHAAGFTTSITGDLKINTTETNHAASLIFQKLTAVVHPHNLNTGISRGHKSCQNWVAWGLVPAIIVLFSVVIGILYYHLRHMRNFHAGGVGYGLGGGKAGAGPLTAAQLGNMTNPNQYLGNA